MWQISRYKKYAIALAATALLFVAACDSNFGSTEVGGKFPGGYTVTEQKFFNNTKECVSYSESRISSPDVISAQDASDDSIYFIVMKMKGGKEAIQSCFVSKGKKIEYVFADRKSKS